MKYSSEIFINEGIITGALKSAAMYGGYKLGKFVKKEVTKAAYGVKKLVHKQLHPENEW